MIPWAAGKMRKKIWKQLEKEGIQCTEFFPALVGRLHLRINYRNHRKIVVIDDCIGYVGGFNIGKEYIDKDPKFGHWRDTHMRITGSRRDSFGSPIYSGLELCRPQAPSFL